MDPPPAYEQVQEQPLGMANPDYPDNPRTVHKEVTILLLGESGVGKSTFINAFANHLKHETMAEAEQDVTCLIPCYFTLYDPANFRSTFVTLGKPDKNEATGNKSGTQHPKCYSFPIGDTMIRLIDTPGIGDTKGVQTDGTNMRNLLDFISLFKEINAICILLKPNNARVSVVFRYCILELLSHLNKSASRNILFLFTNSRSTFYAPGDTAPSLLGILKEVKERPPYVEIPFGQDNVYCFDNEAFRFLVAKSAPNNLVFPPQTERDYAMSWERSAFAFQKMMQYIVTLRPHKVEDTVSVNNARTSIQALTQPLAEISQFITDNVSACTKQRRLIEEFEGNIKALQAHLYTPSIDIISTPLLKPRTVCGDARCCETVTIRGKTKTHYKSICHDPCFLDSDDGNVIGNIGLLQCQTFNIYTKVGEGRVHVTEAIFNPDQAAPRADRGGYILVQQCKRTMSDSCNKCGHSYLTHLHVFSDTERKEVSVRDEVSQRKITSATEAKLAQERQVRTLEATATEWRREANEINRCLSVFACFLSTHALTPFNDAYEDYLIYLIRTAKDSSDSEIQENARELDGLLANYREQKETFKMAFKEGNANADISPRAVQDAIESLCKLKRSGPKIREFLARMKEQKKTAHFAEREVRVEACLTKQRSARGLVAGICRLFGYEPSGGDRNRSQREVHVQTGHQRERFDDDDFGELRRPRIPHYEGHGAPR